MSTAPRLEITRRKWRTLIRELCRRGHACRESGAFLLGNRTDGTAVVCDFAYYDELDPNALDMGYVTFHGSGFPRLWAVCRERGLQVVADVHTHPGDDTRQSGIDKRHPMIPMVGHMALIVPEFAVRNRYSTSGVGIYEYRGADWKARTGEQPPAVRLTWW